MSMGLSSTFQCISCGRYLNKDEYGLCKHCLEDFKEGTQKDNCDNIKTLTINPIKSKNGNFDKFYAEIGWKILQEYYKGNEIIKVKFNS